MPYKVFTHCFSPVGSKHGCQPLLTHSTCEVTEIFQWDLVHLLQLGRSWVYDPKKYPIPPSHFPAPER